MEAALSQYLNFLARQFSIHIPSVRNGNQGVDALLPGNNPLWNRFKGEGVILAARRGLSSNAQFKNLYEEYCAERPTASFDDYVDSALLDFALKLLRRAPTSEAKIHAGARVDDFMNFLRAKRIEAVQVALLFLDQAASAHEQWFNSIYRPQ